MSVRRAPNPNRNFPTFCPYCAGEELYPNEETEFAWKCGECLRIFEVKFYGQDDPVRLPAPAPSTEEALQESLRRHGHYKVLSGQGFGQGSGQGSGESPSGSRSSHCEGHESPQH